MGLFQFIDDVIDGAAELPDKASELLDNIVEGADDLINKAGDVFDDFFDL